MASVRIFDSLRQRIEQSDGLLPQERRAMFWFQHYSTELTAWQNQNQRRTFSTLQNADFSKRLVPPKAIVPGYLYFFQYAPVSATTLDYYDRLPLVLTLSRDSESFMGLNFHYLPYRSRAALFDALYSTRLIPHRNPLLTRIRVSYQLLTIASKYKAFRPCLHRYRYKACKSAMLQVGETEWDIALFLPVERFSKAMRSEVWSDATQAIYGVSDDIDTATD